MARSVKLIFLVTFLCLPTQAIANIFDPSITDLSVEYLGMIFGGSVGGIHLGTEANNNPFFGQLFQVFNGVILAVATFILTYVGTVSIVHTAHEGEVMGKKWSSLWIPLRSASGLLLMAPVPGSGYSLLQVTVMWIILNGVGAADKIWNLIVDNLAQGISPGQTQALDNSSINKLKGLAKSLGPGILKNLICLKVVEDNVDNNFFQSTGQILGANFVDDPKNPAAGAVYFGLLNTNDPDNSKEKAICGNIQITASVNTSDLDPAVSTNQLVTAKTIAYQAKKQALSSMITYIKPVANQIVTDIEQLIKNNKPPTIDTDLQPGLLYPSIGIYADLLSNITKQSILVQLGLANVASASGIDDLVSSNVKAAKAQGWIVAGSFYFMLSKGSKQGILPTANEPFMDIAPNLSNTALKTTSVNNLNTIFTTYTTLLNKPENSAKIRALFNDPSPPPSTGAFHFLNPWNLTMELLPGVGDIIVLAITGIQGALEAFMNSFINIDGDPLLEHAKTGAILMGTCEGILMALIVGFMALSVALVWTSCMLPTQAAVLQIILMVGIPLMSIAAALWTFGATLAIYTPMVPYMMFAITALSWIMLVIEAIVAAPIVALGLIMPAQEELGSTHAALGIIANIFLRPILMLVGLVMSVKIFSVMVKFIGFGFTKSIGILQEVEMYGSLFSCIPISGLYIGFVIALENKCFSLIYQVPDKILRWIGVNSESTDVSAMQEAQKSFESAANNTAQNLKEMGTKPADNIQQQMKEKTSSQNQSGGNNQETKDNNDATGDKPGTSSASTGSASGGTIKAAPDASGLTSSDAGASGASTGGGTIKGGGGSPLGGGKAGGSVGGGGPKGPPTV